MKYWWDFFSLWFLIDSILKYVIEKWRPRWLESWVFVVAGCYYLDSFKINNNFDNFRLPHLHHIPFPLKWSKANQNCNMHAFKNDFTVDRTHTHTNTKIAIRLRLLFAICLRFASSNEAKKTDPLRINKKNIGEFSMLSISLAWLIFTKQRTDFSAYLLRIQYAAAAAAYCSVSLAFPLAMCCDELLFMCARACVCSQHLNSTFYY